MSENAIWDEAFDAEITASEMRAVVSHWRDTAQLANALTAGALQLDARDARLAAVEAERTPMRDALERIADLHSGDEGDPDTFDQATAALNKQDAPWRNRFEAERDEAQRALDEQLDRVNAALALVTDKYSVHWDAAAQCVFVRSAATKDTHAL